MKRSHVSSTVPGLNDVGEEVLRKGGSALKATLTGFFVAAAERPGILFSPISVLVAGLGVGARVYDGRARQPGLGVKRPRGFVEGEAIPPASRVAIPGSVAALSIACAYDTGTTLLACVRPGVQAAKKSGAKERAELLELIGAHGASVLGQPAIKRAWLSQFGPAEGGNCSAADLGAPPDLDGPALLEGNNFRLPWEGDLPAEQFQQNVGHASIAIDAHGQLVALAFGDLADDMEFHPYGVNVPLSAEPVRRGVARFSPGSPLPSPGALEVERSAVGALIGVSAWPRGRQAGSVIRLGRDPETKSVAALS